MQYNFRYLLLKLRLATQAVVGCNLLYKHLLSLSVCTLMIEANMLLYYHPERCLGFIRCLVKVTWCPLRCYKLEYLLQAGLLLQVWLLPGLLCLQPRCLQQATAHSGDLSSTFYRDFLTVEKSIRLVLRLPHHAMLVNEGLRTH